MNRHKFCVTVLEVLVISWVNNIKYEYTLLLYNKDKRDF